MPGKPGAYPLGAIDIWRRENLKSSRSESIDGGGSGILIRALYRLLRIELSRRSQLAADDFIEHMLPRCTEHEKDRMKFRFLSCCYLHFQELMPNENQIDRVLDECKDMI